MFFDGSYDLIRIVTVGSLSYVALIVFLRIAGKRTLTKLNAFDLVITVALGSTLATCLMSKDITLAEGCVAFALLIGLQWIVTWSEVHLPWVERLVKSQPALLYYQGRYLPAMERERVTRKEIEAVVRRHGLRRIDAAEAVILEPDGSFSILQHGPEPASVLDSIPKD